MTQGTIALRTEFQRQLSSRPYLFSWNFWNNYRNETNTKLLLKVK